MSKKRKIIIGIIAGILTVVIAVPVLLFFFVKTQPKQNISGNLNSSLNTNLQNTNLQAKTYKGINGWGYDIYENGKIIIHQPNVPGAPGNSGFATEADAQKEAKSMIDEIKAEALAPTLNPKDLKAIENLIPSIFPTENLKSTEISK